jgi:hypothetical protein
MVSPCQVNLWDALEIDGRLYDVVPDMQGGATLEPAITKTVAEILPESGERPVIAQEFEQPPSIVSLSKGCWPAGCGEGNAAGRVRVDRALGLQGLVRCLRVMASKLSGPAPNFQWYSTGVA